MSGPEVRAHPAGHGGRPPALHVERLYELVGRERDQNEVVRVLRHYVQGERPPVVGAAHVTCSDEAELECVDAFQRNFVRFMLPSLKFFSKAPLRTASLGGRYEWGSVRIAEDHFAQAQKGGDWKLLLVKVNAHVSVEDSPAGPRFGRMGRYRSESVYCGALTATLAGSDLPFANDLEAAFSMEGVDRLSALRERVEPHEQALRAALVSARLQARMAMIDVQDHLPAAPTLYLIVPCVSLNRSGHDTEIVCGLYTADRRGSEAHDEYFGLGDDPVGYRITHAPHASGSIAVDDPELGKPRPARDHRSVVAAEWRRRTGTAKPDPRVRQALEQAEHETRSKGSAYARPVLRTLLGLLLEVSPVPAAVLLFGEGVAQVHHATRAHRLAREAQDDEAAREMLEEIRDRVDHLPPERAEHLVQLLLREYRGVR